MRALSIKSAPATPRIKQPTKTIKRPDLQPNIQDELLKFFKKKGIKKIDPIEDKMRPDISEEVSQKDLIQLKHTQLREDFFGVLTNYQSKLPETDSTRLHYKSRLADQSPVDQTKAPNPVSASPPSRPSRTGLFSALRAGISGLSQKTSDE